MSSASASLDAAAVARIRSSFDRQGAMATLGAQEAHVATMLATMVQRRAEGP